MAMYTASGSSARMAAAYVDWSGAAIGMACFLAGGKPRMARMGSMACMAAAAEAVSAYATESFLALTMSAAAAAAPPVNPALPTVVGNDSELVSSICPTGVPMKGMPAPAVLGNQLAANRPALPTTATTFSSRNWRPHAAATLASPLSSHATNSMGRPLTPPWALMVFTAPLAAACISGNTGVPAPPLRV
jgi:hypothetical protein